MSNRSKLAISGAIALLCFTFASQAHAGSDDTFDLLAKPSNGQAWHSTAKQSDSDEVWAGNEGDRSNWLLRSSYESQSEMAFGIASIDPSGNYVRTSKVLHFKMSKRRSDPNRGEQIVSLDTATAPDPRLPDETRRMLEALPKTTISETYDPQGRLIASETTSDGAAIDSLIGTITSSVVSSDRALFPAGPVHLGESWPVGRENEPAPYWPGGGSTVGFDLTGTLLAVESRDGVRHVLVRVSSSNWKQERSTQEAGPGIDAVNAEMYIEFDLERHRVVDLRMSETCRGFWLDLDTNRMIFFDRKRSSRMTEQGVQVWMIANLPASN